MRRRFTTFFLQALLRRDAARAKGSESNRHFNSRMELYKWEAHASDGGCKVRSNVVVTYLYSNHRFGTILELNMMVEDHTRLSTTAPKTHTSCTKQEEYDKSYSTCSSSTHFSVG